MTLKLALFAPQVYVWARRNEYVRISFLGLFQFRAPFLPWVNAAIALLRYATFHMTHCRMSHFVVASMKTKQVAPPASGVAGPLSSSWEFTDY